MDVFCGSGPGSDKFEFLETDSRVVIQHTLYSLGDWNTPHYYNFGADLIISLFPIQIVVISSGELWLI